MKLYFIVLSSFVDSRTKNYIRSFREILNFVNFRRAVPYRNAHCDIDTVFCIQMLCILKYSNGRLRYGTKQSIITLPLMYF